MRNITSSSAGAGEQAGAGGGAGLVFDWRKLGAHRSLIERRERRGQRGGSRRAGCSLLISSASDCERPHDCVRSSTLAPMPTSLAAWEKEKLLGSRCSSWVIRSGNGVTSRDSSCN